MDNPLRLRKLHHLEFWVGNARQAAYFYRRAFGFSVFAYCGLETGSRESCSYALEQGKARLVLSTPLTPASPITSHLALHGDGVRDIAFEVDDAEAAFKLAVERGARPAISPHALTDPCGTVMHAAIYTYGDTIHSFYSKAGYSGPFLPGYQPMEIPGFDAGILNIDHLVGNVELGKMNEWADWYTRVLGFSRYMSFDDKDISTEFSALMSIVMADDSHFLKMPINEPAAGRKRSQIQEYLDFYMGPGVQHVALRTRDVIRTVSLMRENGVDFLEAPPSYYEMLPERVGHINEDLAAIREHSILVDRDQEGYLLQLFTKPVEDRPTLFFELIQREGSRGFGKGNFKALFEAIELEQARRGNL